MDEFLCILYGLFMGDIRGLRLKRKGSFHLTNFLDIAVNYFEAKKSAFYNQLFVVAN